MQIIHNGAVVATHPTAHQLPLFANDDTVTPPYQYHRPSDETHALILGFVERQHYASVLEIARHLKRKPTPFLRSQLQLLEEHGKLQKMQVIRANGAVKFIYRVGR